ncbi:MAG: hypothetical protein FWE67_03125 [Planctomycetaceae bacterium]|nr:hypothetical protein [Planctomycetaceae bacterium]
MISLSGVSKVFQKLTDTRRKRGVCRPFHSVCSLAFLGLLAHITETACCTPRTMLKNSDSNGFEGDVHAPLTFW